MILLLLSCECRSAILGADFATFLERDFVKATLVFGSLSFLEWNRVRGGLFWEGASGTGAGEVLRWRWRWMGKWSVTTGGRALGRVSHDVTRETWCLLMRL